MGLGFCLVIQIPLAAISYQWLASTEARALSARTQSLNKVLAMTFEERARYGDLVNARGSVIELGRPFGLRDVSVCGPSGEMVPRLHESRCSQPNGEASVPITLSGGESVTLQFLWESPTGFIRAYVFRVLGISAILSVILVLSLTYWVSRRSSDRIGAFSRKIAAARNLRELSEISEDVAELRPLRSALTELAGQLEQATQNASMLEAEAAIGKMASQVAHDIRSPVAAIQAIEKNLSGLSDEQRELLRHAVERIKDISNDLLARRRVVGTQTDARGGSVFDLVNAIVKEKKAQVPAAKRVAFAVECADEDKDIQSVLPAQQLQRILSNIISNSLEAIRDSGSVAVRILRSNAGLLLSIEDDGEGIPNEKLALVGTRGVSFGKSHGIGLGLSHAKETLEEIGGRMTIASTLGKGTRVDLEMPARPVAP